jgi:hypothetical protein
MFVPVSCTSCGKPFQVPDTGIGQRIPCPWCGEVVLALPVAVPTGRAETAVPLPAAELAAEPLSLDEDEPAASSETNRPAATPSAKTAATCAAKIIGTPPQPASKNAGNNTAAPATRRSRWLITSLAVATVVVLGAVGTIGYRNYGAGRISDAVWIDFRPPDGSFSVALPGQPVEETVEANPAGSVTGGKRFTVRGWYSKTTVWFGYSDLAPALVAKLPADRDRVISASVLQAQREREKARLEGTVTNEVQIQENAGWGVELHMDTPNGKAVEWLILTGSAPHPRVYVFGAEGSELTRQSPVCRRLFNSFRVIE